MRRDKAHRLPIDDCEYSQRLRPVNVDQDGLNEPRLVAITPLALKAVAGVCKLKGAQMVDDHMVVPHDQWIEARKKLLVKEKEFTRLREQLSQERRDLPWEAVTKDYVFDGPGRKETLSELFDGRSQLIVYHFMFGPDWEAGCPHCSFWADNFNEIIVHLNQRDVTMIAASRASYGKLAAYKKRMGWSFKWVSSNGGDFNFDYQASFTPEEIAGKQAWYNFAKQDPGIAEREGVSVFHKDASGRLFHTYSTYARGIDILNTAYHYLDLVPKGRDENGRSQYWVRRRDEYAAFPSDKT
jgi:predicted dithiol-disulfide oxidoreductase (DUF899 family)